MLSLGIPEGCCQMLLNPFNLAVIGLCLMFCAGIVFKSRKDMRRLSRQCNLVADPHNTNPVFLFQGNDLVDATPQASALLSRRKKGQSELNALVQLLSPYVPNLRQVLENPPKSKTRIGDMSADSIRVEVCVTDGRTRVAIHGKHHSTATDHRTTVAHDISLAELAMLRDLTEKSPQLIWQEASDGRLLWANQTYMTFADRVLAHDTADPKVWPNTSIFPQLHETLGADSGAMRRLSIRSQGQTADHWFDVTSVPFGSDFIHFATDANAIVRAELERQSFKQTLGKTFAELSCGLAIFDKNRKLTTFNPAILDLTGLSFDFLSNRPSLETMLDRLRETRMLPEPKNYTSWRDQFSAVEEAAKNGTYRETWALPDGRTYRVSGRPHPDGAFAFIFEDISAEVSLTRRFRADIETGQAVLDSIPDAIAVFSSAGTLLISNQAYANLWHANPAVYHEQRLLQTEMKTWKNRCGNAQIWGQIRNFTHQTGHRDAWSDSTLLDDGRQLTCHASAIAAGKTLLRFTAEQKVTPTIQKLMMQDPAIRVGKR